MGWDYTQGATKQDIVNRLITERTIDYKVVGNTLWTVERKYDCKENAHLPTLLIGCYLLQRNGGFGWGYKDMCEAMGPYVFTCPLKFLDMVPEACPEWRAKVRWHHKATAARKAIRANLKVGDTLKLIACKVPEVRVIEIRTRSIIGVANGNTYRISDDLIALDTKAESK